MNTLLALVLAASVANASDNIGPREAQALNLLVEDLDDILASLAAAVHDVRDEDLRRDWRVCARFPILDGMEDPDVDHRDLEAKPCEP